MPIVIQRVWFYALSSLLVVLSSASGISALAQVNPDSAAQTRATAPNSEVSLVTLRGNIHPLAQPRFDRGPAPASMPAEWLMLILKRSEQQETDLQSYLKSVQDPNSSAFRKFLTPNEFGQRYGVSDENLATVESWLKKNGLVIAGVNEGRTAIEFSGTVSQLQQTFHTSIHTFLIDAAEHLANTAEPQIPASLASVVAGVANLNDFKPQPNFVKGSAGKWNPELHRFTPDLTVTVNANEYLFVGPGDAATIYDSPNSFNTHLASNQTQYDGTGITIGIVGTTLLYDSGPIYYRSLFDLPDSGSVTTEYDGSFSNFDQSADETEALLDAEVSEGIAPSAHVIYYGAADTAFQSGLFLAIYRAIDDNNVNILSVSYGECEASLGAAGNLQVLNAWEQAAAQGITVTVSTNDSGSAGCDNQNTETVSTQGLAVNGLASTPYNIAVGGTDFDVLDKSFSTYVGSTNSANFTSALSYIPENPWNDSTNGNGLLASNSAYRNSLGQTNILAGGGGASSLGNGGQTGYPKPLWQQDFTFSDSDAVRDLPDVSLLSGDGKYGAVWAVCEGSDCSSGPSSTIHGVGGTSAAAPAFAGFLALVNQKVGGRNPIGPGQLDPV